ncbi:Com family DNA-binding transcriptional regulator [Actinobacillus minor]
MCDCNKLLAKASTVDYLEIKYPRCKTINYIA